LEAWLEGELRPWFSDRLLDVDEDVFVVWRRLVENGKAMRHIYPQPDLFIAATAVLHDLRVVTRNTNDFLPTRVPVLNPWADTEPQLTE
jgi:predicted nucleic acid-binding protein